VFAVAYVGGNDERNQTRAFVPEQPPFIKLRTKRGGGTAPRSNLPLHSKVELETPPLGEDEDAKYRNTQWRSS
jgi:hypothetical protein